MKPRNLEEIKIKVDAIKDGLGKPIDPKIKPLVIGLWKWGIKTDMSCQGHFSEGRGWNFPWVTVLHSQARKIAKIVARQNRPVLRSGRRNKNQWVLKPHGHAFHLQPEKIKSLRQLQRDAIVFGKFLQSLPDTWSQ